MINTPGEESGLRSRWYFVFAFYNLSKILGTSVPNFLNKTFSLSLPFDNLLF